MARAFAARGVSPAVLRTDSPIADSRETTEAGASYAGAGSVFRQPVPSYQNGQGGNRQQSALLPPPVRGASQEIARTLRSGTLTGSALSRQADSNLESVSRKVDMEEMTAAPAPAPPASEASAAKDGESGDLMALERQVDALWDRFMQRLRIEQERSGFY